MAKPVGRVAFDRADLDLFGAASGDFNPLHLSDGYARRTPYGERVVPGVLGAMAALASGAERPELGVLAITHYERLLEELVPDVVHVLVGGRIVESGGAELARTVAAKGYEAWR